MQNHAFVDRHEASELFKLFMKNNTEESQQLSPILTFIAPPGGGKSMLMEHLYTTYCHQQDGSLDYPYAHLDFAQSDVPKDLLSILIDLRNQLANQRDRNGRSLQFRRFDLGVIFVLVNATSSTSDHLSTQEAQKKVQEFLSYFGRLGELGEALGNVSLNAIFGFGPVIAYILKHAEHQIQPLQERIQRSRNGPAWEWYASQPLLHVHEDASIRDLLQRLLDITAGRRPSRQRFIEQILPAAFLADICDTLNKPVSQVWKRTTKIPLFLDSFETLLALPGNSNVGIHLLEALSTQYDLKNNGEHPLLLVVGSQQRLFEQTPTVSTENSPFTPLLNTTTPRNYAKQCYERWFDQFSSLDTLEQIDLSSLSIEFWLRDLAEKDIQEYLTQLGIHQQTTALSSHIYRITSGHPLFMSIVATEASRLIIRKHPPTIHELEQVADRAHLFDRLLAHLSEKEKVDLILCAIPRKLTVECLRVVLQLESEIEAQRRWWHYQRLAIFHTLDKNSLQVHPVMRTLLLHQLQGYDSQSDYYRVHTLLLQHFQKHSSDDQNNLLEVAYHALALGNPEMAIQLAIAAYDNNDTLWDQLFQIIESTPAHIIPGDIEHRISDTSINTNETSRIIEAIVLYNWLLSSTKDDQTRQAFLHHRLGGSYSALAKCTHQGLPRERYRNQILRYYEAALLIYTEQDFPLEWAATKYDLGQAYFELFDTDNYWRMARRHAREVLQVYTMKDHPDEFKKANDLQNSVDEKLESIDRAQRKSVLSSSPSDSHAHTHLAEPSPYDLLKASIPPYPPRTKRNKLQWILIGMIILLLITTIPFVSHIFSPSSGTSNMTPTPGISGIEVHKIQNGDTIGISDGRSIFDTANDRKDVTDKQQAAAALTTNTISSALIDWQNAVLDDPRDAEAHIYEEDTLILDKGQNYVDIVTAVTLTNNLNARGQMANGRDALQGAYIAQEEYNSTHPDLQVRLLIANSGRTPDEARPVAQQIAQLAKKDLHFIAMMGWTNSSRTFNALDQWKKDHVQNIVMLSQGAASALLSQWSAYFFRIVPQNKIQGQVGADYIASTLHMQRVALFYDKNDAYTNELGGSFKTRFEQDGGTLVAIEHFKSGETTDSSFKKLLDDALSHQPQLIYFAGSTTDIGQILPLVDRSDAPLSLKVMTGDAGGGISTEAVGPTNKQTGYTRLLYTAFAFHDEWNVAGFPHEPQFFTDYRTNFKDPKYIGDGSTIPTSYALTSYDGMITLLRGYQDALQQKKGNLPTISDLQKALVNIAGKNAIQGLSGQIDFDPLTHNSRNKALTIVHIRDKGPEAGTAYIMPNEIFGCYKKGCASSYTHYPG